MGSRRGWHRVGAGLLLGGVGFFVLLLSMGRRVEAGVQALSQTTLADFSPGEFLRTGLANMGDGAVSLLRAGLSGEWITTVVTAGLIPRWGHMAVYTASRLYVLGGLTSSNDMIAGPSLVQSATVRSDHDLTSWVTEAASPVAEPESRALDQPTTCMKVMGTTISASTRTSLRRGVVQSSAA